MAEHIVSARSYFAVFFALMGLTAITVAVAFNDFGAWNNFVAIAIAVTKATLVILYFMHVRYSTHLTWVMAGAGFFWTAVMIAYVMTDYVARGWIPVPIAQ
ncbi:cytochrome C oxidase subunit IV family protein [Candidatus Binatia bacterium]|nr:cytochrome C oxidase subunit IV family protein [Candidatus Binatia bacterium]